MSMNRRLMKSVFVLVLVLFCAVSLLGLFHTSIAMDTNGTVKGGCPFMPPGQTVICTMSAFQHISAWQSMFTGTLQLGSAILLLLLLAAILFLQAKPRPAFAEARRHSRVVYERIPSRPTVLQELLSQGILNPKLF